MIDLTGVPDIYDGKEMRIALVPIFAGLALLLGTPAHSAPPKVVSDRPNLLVVIADDCTFNELPLYGGRNVQTPNLDRLAAQGLRFSRAYVGMSMCTALPHRAVHRTLPHEQRRVLESCRR